MGYETGSNPRWTPERGHKIGYASFGEFGSSVGCICGWAGNNNARYDTHADAIRAGAQHRHEFGDRALTLEERVERIEKILRLF